ncbi:pH-sensitive chloride channel 2-like [Diorhabda sublineata]|uniref:pH-sensitive chloride channel 2-like n=1 Tax=Diorhabda sublineata TaxID=1163346 RepID=UPI0024E0B447|nr:pH-sensitive chloride channel 2-like [Diorhabda sublineata]
MQHPPTDHNIGSKIVFIVFLCCANSKLVSCTTVSEIGNSSTSSSIMNIPEQDTITSTASTTEYRNATLQLAQTSDISSTNLTAVPNKESENSTDVNSDCPNITTFKNLDKYTQEELVHLLTDPCRYDRLVKPPTDHLEVFFRFDMTHIETAEQLEFKTHILIQQRYTDTRLSYSALSPKREVIKGEDDLKNKIWIPHLILTSEKQSTLMGLNDKDIFIQISPNGEVIYAYRLSVLFFCWMNLKKFPFDIQVCDLTWVSWVYNADDLILKWEPNSPFSIESNLHLTEFVIEKEWIETDIMPDRFYQGGQGKSANYSAVIFKFQLAREVGYYMMDYFLPSILLVCTSWVTFWLQADASPPRVVLGTSTMLTFITLNSGLGKTLPKVSYIKANEIWFLGCISFIFFSLAEFAFVNVIWRRKKKVELIKANSTHILKGALTPSLARKEVRKANSMNNLHKARSCTSLDKEISDKNTQLNYLTVHSLGAGMVPTITHSSSDLINNDENVTTVPIPEAINTNHVPFHTMTPQEVAIWIDKKSRIVFPVAFIIFNILYWSFVYAL